VVHAKGAGAYGTFVVTNDITDRVRTAPYPSIQITATKITPALLTTASTMPPCYPGSVNVVRLRQNPRVPTDPRTYRAPRVGSYLGLGPTGRVQNTL
jgi:hypothetical protein